MGHQTPRYRPAETGVETLFLNIDKAYYIKDTSMATLLKKHTTAILLSLLLLSYALGWIFPSHRFILGSALVLLAIAAACFTVITKHRTAYFQAEITREMFVRNVFIEISGILLAMVCAALLGRYLAEMATRQIGHYLTRFVLGILVGLLIGGGVGFIVRKLWGRFLQLERR